MRYLKGLFFIPFFYFLIFSLMVWSKEEWQNATRYTLMLKLGSSYNTPAEHKTGGHAR